MQLVTCIRYEYFNEDMDVQLEEQPLVTYLLFNAKYYFNIANKLFWLLSIETEQSKEQKNNNSQTKIK